MAEATADTSDKIQSEVKIETIGPAAKRLTITVSPETVTEKLEEALGTLVTNTALPGFRKGKAPRRLLERRFGTDMRRETKNQIIAGAYAGAIEEHGIKPVGEPEPAPEVNELELEEGKPFTFAVEVEIVPEFELPTLEGIEVKKPILEISPEMIEAELERYRRHFGEVHRITSDFVEGDRLVGRAEVVREGDAEPFFTHDEVLVVHPGTKDGGRGQMLGLLIDELASRLEGKQLSDTLTIEALGPEGHEREDIRGKKLTITFNIGRAERIEPASVEQIVERLGIGSEQILHEQIRASLETRRDEEQIALMRRQVCDHLLEAVDFELPSKITSRQAGRLLERQRLELLYRGMTPDEVEDALAQARAGSESIARQQLKQFFLLLRLAEHYSVEVSQQELNGRVAALAVRRGMRPEQLMTELAQSGRLSELSGQLREAKALDRVVHHAHVTEIPADEWRKLMEEKSQAGDEQGAGAKEVAGKSGTGKGTGSGTGKSAAAEAPAKPRKKTSGRSKTT